MNESPLLTLLLCWITRRVTSSTLKRRKHKTKSKFRIKLGSFELSAKVKVVEGKR